MSRFFEGTGSKGRVGAGAFTDSLREGDLVRAEVMSSAKGIVVLKTEAGQTFKAKLDTAADFSPGDKVFLEVTAKENEAAFLSIVREDEVLRGGASVKSGSVSGFEDKSLAPFAAKLAELNLPVSEKTAHAMRELIAQNPGMTLDEAAFLASNRLSGNEGLMKAALALISSGDKTDAMLERLLALLGQASAPGPAEPGADVPSAQSNWGPVTPGTAAPVAHVPGEQALLMDWLAQVRGNAQGPTDAGGQVQQTSSTSAEPIIAHNDTIMQSRNVNSYENILQNNDFFAKQPVLQPQNQIISVAGADNPQFAEQNDGAAISERQDAAAKGVDGQQNPAPTQEAALAQQVAVIGRQAAASTSTPPQQASLNETITQLLSELPEFRETPVAALERFSNMLLRVAGDSAEISNGDTEKLKLLLDKLFTRIEKNDQDAGQRLKGAREELFARLSFIEEAIMRASPSAKAEMLDQTQRLMEHVRTLNNIDQFVYMQLPVTLGEERKSAELYLFKKKGGKRNDPDNVNILLALDLEHMGHWEALVNIRNKDVSIKMEVSGAAEKDHFSSHTVLLHNMLAEADFKLVSTDISCSDEETTPLTALAVLERQTSVKKAVDFFI